MNLNSKQLFDKVGPKLINWRQILQSKSSSIRKNQGLIVVIPFCRFFSINYFKFTIVCTYVNLRHLYLITATQSCRDAKRSSLNFRREATSSSWTSQFDTIMALRSMYSSLRIPKRSLRSRIRRHWKRKKKYLDIVLGLHSLGKVLNCIINHSYDNTGYRVFKRGLQDFCLRINPKEIIEFWELV